MNEDLTELSSRLSKLQIRKTRVVHELQLIRREEELVKTLIKESSGPTGTDSQGDKIRSGDKVTTLTRGLYYERIARVTLVKPDNQITIEYLESKKVTWRKGHNLLKLQK